MLKRIVFVIVMVVASSLILVTNAAADWAFACVGMDSNRCSWILTSGGVPPYVPAGQTTYKPITPDPCSYHLVDPPPGDPSWGGNDPEKGRLWYSMCPRNAVRIGNDDGANTWMEMEQSIPYYVPDGTPPDGSSYIQPETLLARAEGELSVPKPEITFGPDASQVAVKIPVWLSVENAESITRTATAGDMTATITAELASVQWDTGEPGDPALPGSATTVVDCDGPGTPFQPGLSPDQPPCGYTYIWRSLPERTGDAGFWTVTAEATWLVSWSVSSPTAGEVLSGSETATVTNTAPLEVREWSAILVNEAPD